MIVLDASALIRLYVPDGPIPPGLEEAVDAAESGLTELFVPDLLFAEVAHVLRRKERDGALRPEEVDLVVAAARALRVTIVSMRDLLVDAIALARESRLTTYDASYVVLAARLGADLITADDEMERAWRALPHE